MAWFDRLPAGIRVNRLLRTVWSELTFPQSCPPGHFYSPIPARRDILRDGQRIFDRECRQLPEIDLREQDELALLDRLSKHSAAWREDRFKRFRVRNDYLPPADAIVLFAFLVEMKPRQYLEIGSGFSSALVLDVREQLLDNQLHCTFIEPDTERLESLLTPGDRQLSTIIKQRVQEVPDDIFSGLENGDILFVDGSHVSKVGSDLNDVLFRILPQVAPGVLIHFHDITWPFEYRQEDVLRGRSWNEAYILRAFLANNDLYRIKLFGSWLEQCHSSEWLNAFPQARGSAASSLWIVKDPGTITPL